MVGENQNVDGVELSDKSYEVDRRSMLKSVGAGLLTASGATGLGTAKQEDGDRSAVEAGLAERIQELTTNATPADYRELHQLLADNDVNYEFSSVKRPLQEQSDDGPSTEHWFNEGSSTITQVAFLYKKAENHDDLDYNMYQFDVSWDMARTDDDCAVGTCTLDSPSPMDRATVTFDSGAFEYVPDTNPDGGVRHSGRISNGDQSESGLTNVSNKPVPGADIDNAVVVQYDDYGSILGGMDTLPSEGSGFMGCRLLHTGDSPANVTADFIHLWSALDFGRWTNFLEQASFSAFGVSLDGSVLPTGIDKWSEEKTWLKPEQS